MSWRFLTALSPIIFGFGLELIKSQDRPDAIIEAAKKTARSIIGDRGVELVEMLEERAIEIIKASVTAFAIRDWSQPPFGAACHAWKPGVDVPRALERLKAFGLIGRKTTQNIHVCGEAYSDYQGFIEGALRSAEKIIKAIDGTGAAQQSIAAP